MCRNPDVNGDGISRWRFSMVMVMRVDSALLKIMKREFSSIVSPKRFLAFVCVTVSRNVPNSVTPWTSACLAPLCVGFPKQEDWSAQTFPPRGIFQTWGSNPLLLHLSPELAGFFITGPPGQPVFLHFTLKSMVQGVL